MDPVLTAKVYSAAGAAVAAVVLLSIRRLRPSVEAPAGPALAAGFVAGFLGVCWPPSYPILEAWRWLLPIGFAGGALAVLASRRADPPEILRWTLRAALAAFAVGVTVLHPTAAWLGGSFVVVLASTASFDGVARRTGAGTFLATVLVVATATAVATGFSNSGALAATAGVLAGATGACVVLTRFVPVATRNAVPLVAVLLAAIAMNSLVYADLPVASAVLLTLAAPAAWLASALVASQSVPRRAVAVVAAAALVAGAGAAFAVAKSEPMGY